jgi:hypothetical protein
VLVVQCVHRVGGVGVVCANVSCMFPVSDGYELCRLANIDLLAGCALQAI